MLGPGVLSVSGLSALPATNARSSPKFPHSPGDLHRKQRKMLAPAFSVEHLRGLVPIFYEVTHKARTSPPPVSARSHADDDITAAPAPASMP